MRRFSQQRRQDPTGPSKGTAAATRSNSMRVALSFGDVLGHIAGKYGSLMKALQESVQNALDAAPSRVNLVINLKVGKVYVQDDGLGATRDHMAKCLGAVGLSQKDKGKLGQFGIGVVAPFGKCRRFYFTTQPADKSEPAYRLVFDCSALKKARTSSDIPCVPSNIEDQWWNSQLEIEGINASARMSRVDLDQLCDALYKSFARALKKHNTAITVRLTTASGDQLPERTIAWVPFQGSPLKTKSYTCEDGSSTTFRMFVVEPDEKGRRKGQGVRVVDSSKVFSKVLVAKLFPEGDNGASYLSKKTAQAITDGFFEGEIQLGNSVELDPTRDFFKDTEAAWEAALHIESWLDEVGDEIRKKVSKAEQDNRYRDLGNVSLKVIDKFLKEADEAKGLAALINKAFKWGSQGIGHTKTPAKTDGTIRGKRSTGGSGEPRQPSGTGPVPDPDKKKGKKKKKKSKPNDTPLVVDDPDGNERTLTRHDSTGLRIRYRGGDSDLWDLDKEQGILTMNIAHPTWTSLDEDATSPTMSVRNRLIQQLQERIIQAVFGVLATSLEYGWEEHMEDILMNHMHEDVLRFGWSLRHADEIARRGRYVKKSKS